MDKIPKWQQNLVLDRIVKTRLNPERMLDWGEASKLLIPDRLKKKSDAKSLRKDQEKQFKKVLLTVQSISELPSAASAIINYSTSTRIFLFYGEMGAGKTTLIKYLCEYLSTTEPVTSPTFSIVNEYIGFNGQKIYHFDFYRLKNQTEALDMGYEEYFYSDAFCFIEWPEKIPGLLPEHYVSIKINLTDHDTRQIIIEKI